MKKLIILLLIISLPIFSFADNSYVKKGSIGTQKAQPEDYYADIYSYRPIETWIGNKFVFYPKRKRDLIYTDKYDDMIEIVNDPEFGRDYHPIYKNCVGRVGTVTKIDKKITPSPPGHPAEIIYDVYLKMDDNGKTYKILAREGIVEGLVSVTDIENARKEWIGKTLWYLRKYIYSYDEEKDQEKTISVGKYTPLKVMDVVASWDPLRPIRFIVQTDRGEIGFVDLNFSGTNVPDGSWYNENRFGTYFITEDPQNWPLLYKFLIRFHVVKKGMNTQQVLVALGEPVEKIKTSFPHEEWIYPKDKHLIFEKDILKQKITPRH